eukprot:6106382-Heterocapsa_arctica.AAC.1
MGLHALQIPTRTRRAVPDPHRLLGRPRVWIRWGDTRQGSHGRQGHRPQRDLLAPRGWTTRTASVEAGWRAGHHRRHARDCHSARERRRRPT